MLETVEFLKTHGLDALTQQFHLHARRHGAHQSLVLLKYDQLNSPMSAKIVWECRGLIVDENDGWRPVCYPFDKFFNHHEGKGPSFDWKSAILTEKLDGSLITLYHHADAWHVSTSSVPDGSGGVRETDYNFAEMFWRVWHAQGLRLPTDPGVCYMFELLGPPVQNLVRQHEERLVAIGARDMRTLTEVPIGPLGRELGWPLAKTWPVDTLEQAVRMSLALDPTRQEGFVAVDASFHRVKIKSPQYVALSHLGSGDGRFDERHMLSVVRTNEGSEFLSYMPQYRDLYEGVRARFEAVVQALEAAWAAHGNVEDKSDFGRRTAGVTGQSVLFTLRNKRVSTVREGLAGASIRQLEQWVGVSTAPVR